MAQVFLADSFGKKFGQRVVLQSASVWATRGCITVLLGRNGSGKSTLLRLAVGLTWSDYGTVHFNGRVHTRPRLPTLAAAGLFFLPDQGLLSPRLSLRSQLTAFERRFPGVNARAAAEQLALRSLLDSPSIELSGGERRRAEVALAIARRPTCLIADEPLAGISPKDAEAITAAIIAMKAQGCAIIVTGHDVSQLLSIADEVVWMVAGTTHGLGKPQEALAKDQFRREYLGYRVV